MSTKKWRCIDKVKHIRTKPIAIVVGACIAQLIDNIAFTISFACIPHLFEDMKLASESKIGLAATMFGAGSFMTSALSGLLNGMASGLVYPISAASVGDVYPHKLLGLQMSLLNVFNNAGPILGGALYDYIGVRGVSVVLMTIGSILALILTFGISEPLLIHEKLIENHSLVDTESYQLKDIDTESEKTVKISLDAEVNQTSVVTIPQNIPIWRLALQWQVLLASMITIFLGSLAGSLDNVLTMHSKDAFKVTASKTGLLFVLNGGVAIMLSVPTGWCVDWIIRRFGEKSRSYIEITGMLLTGGAVLSIGLSTSFTAIIGIEAWLSAALLIANIPVMSSFGDFVNSLGIDSMAQCYGIYNSVWSLSSTFAPPFATWMYTRVGFKNTVAGLLTSLCLLCALLITVEVIRRSLRNRH
ncbi:MFS general substrate transporter [Coemansia reversa NRRL 1564]|uniref:MFS general substrate transporter n=1 Tax=Coemansia reversa (strain ATCC 12441 / NRRL 1564) TaxID=763665 RepID=A0A2G5BHR5_COERN|nr:MFS general substrate transporter [Coemansia reversa NRRL 1564]|eukprot:PIA18277.1 MFS general substrate transporter [Coemansia reversa NRRL 1564]